MTDPNGDNNIDFAEIARRYIDSWNETDEVARAQAVAELYADGATYVDPLGVAEGRQSIAATIGAVQSQFPGFRFRLVGPVDGHHNLARFGWELGPEGVEPGGAPIAGFDVAVSDDAGQVVSIHGFLDRVPA